ncbi:ABC transporter ATP-binding protein [Oscillochloris sp. ZM17-4]|uniref:ABC transporter ATP-binding protein n=1 Tax=Oscillochloris sp. ZM17-4 TaxID=2866714 RepID=UPI001C731D58|nr:ABC transporter ATP-binding protein [Oscillochloris sp. ZM17-4]MBX0326185.1 ABC transporter ATP-binding protein [Oscillochloris sp. ZM17-4]
MTLAIETVSLTRRYGRAIALDNLNLTVQQGSIYGFIGPNGAGKTTTLRLLAGLLAPSSGEVRLMGKLQHIGSAQRLVGYMPDVSGVYDDLRVWEYLDFFARCYGMATAERRKTVGSLLDLVGLDTRRDTFVQSLSRGMQQRLSLAHALVHNPPVLLLDEPASGLDPRARVELRELLRALREMGKTVVLSSHILSELAEVCNEIGIIESGRMVVSGSVDVVRQQLQGGAKLRIKVLHDPREAEAALRPLIARAEDAVPSGQDESGRAEDVPERPAGLPTIRRLSGDPSDRRVFLIEAESLVEEDQAALLAYLLSKGVAVSEFGAQAESLEDLFLRLTAE